MKSKLSQTKNKIIHVAKLLFTEMSVYKATMNDIANAANMSRRTLYMHFKSKEEIYLACQRHQCKIAKSSRIIFTSRSKIKTLYFSTFQCH